MTQIRFFFCSSLLQFSIFKVSEGSVQVGAVSSPVRVPFRLVARRFPAGCRRGGVMRFLGFFVAVSGFLL